MRKALVIGINHYVSGGPLYGCVDDAHKVAAHLERHADGSINFDCLLLTATGSTDIVPRAVLKDSVSELFATDAEIALFYFAGHGHIEAVGGYLLASDARRGDDGVPLAEIVQLANASPAKNRVIILDSCHSGIAGATPADGGASVLHEGLSILTASTADQYATEANGQGVFTELLVDALNGAAANLTGDVTPGSVYAHIDQSLGAWQQRPVFKTNVKSFVSLRRVNPPIPLAELQSLPSLFPHPGYQFQLDPEFEPEMKGRDPGMPLPDPQKNVVFAILQRLNRVNLVVPVGATHMWNAAMESRACRLTVLGEHYRRLADRKRL